MANRPIVCIDFDGVIHSYDSGWIDATTIADPPVDGALSFLRKLAERATVHVYSSRSHQEGGIHAMQQAIIRWMEEAIADASGVPAASERVVINEFVLSTLKWPTYKPSALVTLDDRVLRFKGPQAWPAVDKLLDFKPWNKR